MRLNRTFRSAYALLLALMLPLQGYAAMPVCAHQEPTQSAPPSAAVMAGGATATAETPRAAAVIQHHCGGDPTVTHRHDCGGCCCGAAISIARFPTMALRRALALGSSTAPASPSKGLPDRLDRPPRYSRA